MSGCGCVEDPIASGWGMSLLPITQAPLLEQWEEDGWDTRDNSHVHRTLNRTRKIVSATKNCNEFEDQVFTGDNS